MEPELVDVNEDLPQDTTDNGPTEDGINPAWSNLLEKMPSSLHGVLIPELKAWDSNVQGLVGKVHSEYEPYKPFKENNIAPEQLNEAYGVYQALQADPRAFLEAAQKYYGITPEQGQPPVEDQHEEIDPTDIENHPEFLRVKGIAETVAQAELARHQAAKQAEEDAALDEALTKLATEHGEFDQDYVVNKAMTGNISLEDAVKQYHNTISQAVQAHTTKMNSAPVVMGAGGGTPSTAISADQLKDETVRKNLVAQMLARSKQGG